MNGLPHFFGGGHNSIPISGDEIQLISLIGFILVGLVYSCGSLRKKPEKILEVMLESGLGEPQLLKAVEFVRDALRKHPIDACDRWFIERSEFGDFVKRFRAMKPR